jgi:hypothetical protein
MFNPQESASCFEQPFKHFQSPQSIVSSPTQKKKKKKKKKEAPSSSDRRYEGAKTKQLSIIQTPSPHTERTPRIVSS